MLKRRARGLIRQRLATYPAVALIGPRQSGKTTLARAVGGHYFDLEQEADRLRLDLTWDEVAPGKKLVILDEAQSWPEVFERLRGAIDKNRKRADPCHPR
jgi:predicted AAA+ superfamily ATPase